MMVGGIREGFLGGGEQGTSVGLPGIWEGLSGGGRGVEMHSCCRVVWE